MDALKKLLKHDIRFRWAFGIFSVIALMVLLSFFSPYGAREWNVVPATQPPSLQHPFGTNSMGQDIFWKLTFAVRNSMILAVIAASVSRVIAIIVGLVAGYLGGIPDRILMTVNDSFIIIPILPILILLSTILSGIPFYYLGCIIALFGWSQDARLIRSLTLSLRERTFTHTAYYSGMGMMKIVLREHLPYMVPILMATIMSNMLWAIGMEITLAVIGLAKVETPTLGVIMYWASEYNSMLTGTWWWLFFPISLSVLIFIGLYMFSTSLNRFLDPRTRLMMISERKSE